MKQLLTIALFAALLLSVSACSSGNSTTEPTTVPAASPTSTPINAVTAAPVNTSLNLFGSTIVKTEIDNLTRADLWAIVPNADSLTENDIKECMTNIIKDYTSKNKVTAVTLYLADNENDVAKSSYTLGMCTYYPGGDISNALTTTAGDYTSFVYKYNISSRADKNKPTDLEFEIYDYVNSELEKNSDEDAVNQKAAAKYNISVDELNLIWNRVYTYKH